MVLDACLRRHDGDSDFLRVCQYSFPALPGWVYNLMALSKKNTRNIFPRGILDKEWAGKETPVQLIVLIALFLILFLFINFLTGFFSFIVPAALIMSFLLYLAFKIRKSGRPDIELAQLEENEEKEAKKIILDKLGIQVFMYLNPTAKAMNVYQTDICKKLLNRDE